MSPFLKDIENSFLLDSIPVGMGITTLDGEILICNDLAKDFFGIDDSKKIHHSYVNPNDRATLVDVLQRYGRVHNYLVRLNKDGREVQAVLNSVLCQHDGTSFILTAVHHLDGWLPQDLDKQSLITALEEKVKILEQKETLLKTMQQQWADERQEQQANVAENFEKLVMPWLTRLKGTNLDERQLALVEELEKNMNDVFSPFARNLSRLNQRFSPTEQQVANLIRAGVTSKEIATMLGVSPRTIETHRHNIRKKLGLNNKKVSLAAYFYSLSLEEAEEESENL